MIVFSKVDNYPTKTQYLYYQAIIVWGIGTIQYHECFGVHPSDNNCLLDTLTIVLSSLNKFGELETELVSDKELLREVEAIVQKDPNYTLFKEEKTWF